MAREKWDNPILALRRPAFGRCPAKMGTLPIHSGTSCKTDERFPLCAVQWWVRQALGPDPIRKRDAAKSMDYSLKMLSELPALMGGLTLPKSFFEPRPRIC